MNAPTQNGYYWITIKENGRRALARFDAAHQRWCTVSTDPISDDNRIPDRVIGSWEGPLFMGPIAEFQTKVFVPDGEVIEVEVDQEYINHLSWVLSWVNGYNAIAAGIEDWAERKGWNDDDPLSYPEALRMMGKAGYANSIEHPMVVHYDIAKIGLMVTELGEAIEGRRHGDPPSDKIPEFTAQEEELADAIIRIMHYSNHRKLRVAEALLAKLAYNEGRPYKHGKQA